METILKICQMKILILQDFFRFMFSYKVIKDEMIKMMLKDLWENNVSWLIMNTYIKYEFLGGWKNEN